MTYPPFTTATCWEVMGWDDYAATHNAIVQQVNARRSLRLRRFQESMQNFLLESRLANYWYQTGIELALETTLSNGDPYQVLPSGITYQLVHQLPPNRIPEPCYSCGMNVAVLYVEQIILYTECFCCTRCAGLYQQSLIQYNRWLHALMYREVNPIPEDSTEWESFFALVPPLSGTCEHEGWYQERKKEVMRATPLKKERSNGQEIPAASATGRDGGSDQESAGRSQSQVSQGEPERAGVSA